LKARCWRSTPSCAARQASRRQWDSASKPGDTSPDTTFPNTRPVSPPALQEFLVNQIGSGLIDSGQVADWGPVDTDAFQKPAHGFADRRRGFSHEVEKTGHR
jgi:hypothetical protein